MRKKSIKLAADDFVTNTDEIMNFIGHRLEDAELTDQDESWCYDLAIIRLYREFEDLMLNCLIALINNDTATFSKLKKRSFPPHMTVEVCEYLICGDGYFNFSGRDGLIKTIKKFVPARHWLVKIFKKEGDYIDALNRLSALRNFAAHDSPVSKKRALEAIDQKRMNSSGDWLKRQNRYKKIHKSLQSMAKEIRAAAPY